MITLVCKVEDGVFVGKVLKETLNGKVKVKFHLMLLQFWMLSKALKKYFYFDIAPIDQTQLHNLHPIDKD